MGWQLFQENAVGDGAKGFVEVQVDTSRASPLIHWAGHLVIKGDQVCQAGPAFPKALLSGTAALVILNVLCDTLRTICSITLLGCEDRWTLL